MINRKIFKGAWALWKFKQLMTTNTKHTKHTKKGRSFHQGGGKYESRILDDWLAHMGDKWRTTPAETRNNQTKRGGVEHQRGSHTYWPKMKTVPKQRAAHEPKHSFTAKNQKNALFWSMTSYYPINAYNLHYKFIAGICSNLITCSKSTLVIWFEVYKHLHFYN